MSKFYWNLWQMYLYIFLFYIYIGNIFISLKIPQFQYDIIENANGNILCIKLWYLQKGLFYKTYILSRSEVGSHGLNIHMASFLSIFNSCETSKNVIIKEQ